MKVFRLCCKSMNFTHRYQLDIIRTQDADWRLGRKWSFRFWSEDSVEKFFFIFCCQFFVSSKAEIWQKCVANNVHPKIPPNFMKKSQLDVPIPTRSRENPDRHWPSIRANPDPGLPYQIHFRLDFLCFVLIFFNWNGFGYSLTQKQCGVFVRSPNVVSYHQYLAKRQSSASKKYFSPVKKGIFVMSQSSF